MEAIIVYTISTVFEWDPLKAESNRLKHGIDFETAITIFDDRFALIQPDEKHSDSTEIREIIIGEADPGVLVVIFTIRTHTSLYRVISARKASRRERKRYEKNKRISV
jgi:uncharacterized DUF497 family protein